MNRDAARDALAERYAHLRIPEKPGYVLTNRGWESPGRHRLRALAAVPLVRRMLRGLGTLGARVKAVTDYLTSLPDEDAADRKFRELLARDAHDAQEAGSGYGSADAVAEFTTTLGYARIFEAEPEDDRTGTVDTARCVEETVSSVVAADARVASCLNFGAAYAHADARLAARFPQIEFVALDRSPLTQALNALALPSTPNLEFLADDVFHALVGRAWGHGLFVHARTLVQLPMSFIERLYGAVQAAGFEYVLGFEPVGLSRVSGSNFRFSDTTRPSEHFRDNLFLHNYPGLLAAAGYHVESIDLLKTSHPHEDYRILYFVAKRCAPSP